jgi:tetraacyldisaccharide 4'-kinase
MAKPTTSVEELGDEPSQIYAKYPEVIVAVDANRQNGITQLENRVQPELILLDDAFQHRKVKSGFSILLTTYGKLYINDWYLPTGTLRDSKQEAKRADLIVVTKCPNSLSDSQRKEIEQKLQPQANQEVIFSFIDYDLKLKGAMNDLSIDQLVNKSITLVTGIANPGPLVTYLKEKGIFLEHLRFRDHHFFTQTELDQLRKKECIITTEKDYVRLKGNLENLSYISMKHRFSQSDHQLLESRVRTFM